MRFCSLGSGSTGNATVVEAGDGGGVTRVLIDCGFSLRELDLRLARAGLCSADLDAVFVTHEHGDHIGSAVALARRNGLPLWTSRGTWRAVRETELPAPVRYARDGDVARPPSRDTGASAAAAAGDAPFGRCTTQSL